MAVTQATQLADFTSGIGTAGAILEVDNVNNKIGIGTTNPQALLQVGDIIKMDGVTGVITATSFSGNVTGVSTGLTGTPDITVGNIVAAGATFSGVVTYEDVTNVDSLGIVTARTGLEVTANGLVINAGVSTFAADLSIADKIVHTGDTNTAIRFPSADTFTVETSGTERLRVGSTGTVGVAGLSTATSFGAFNHLSAPFGGGTVTYTVTVATKTANHRYNGSGSSNRYLIDGVEAPFLTLTPGRTYRFVHDNTGSHPLKFYLEADKTTLYSTGVTFDNAYTEIVVSDTTPQILHYQCSSHSLMGNSVSTSSNIAGGFNVVDESSDTSCNVLFTTDATGTALEAKTGTNLTFNSSSGALTATSFVGDVTGDVTGNADTATTLETARNIGGVSFDGSADINLPGVNASGNQDTSGTAAVATNITVADESSDTSCNVLFTTAATGNLAPKSGTNLTFNSSSGALTATSFATGAEGSSIIVNSATITGPSSITIDPDGVGDNTGTVHILGDLQVEGTTTTIDSTTVNIADKNIQVATGAANDAAANGAGFTIDSGDGDKTFQFEATGDNFGSSENLNLASSKTYKINNTDVLSATTLGSAVVNSSLTSVGTLNSLDVSGALTGAHANLSGVVTATSFSGNGASLSSLNGSNISSGTIAAARVATLNQDTTGNAATATALETARNIGGVSFDGSANINLPGVNQAGNQDTTGNAATATTATNVTVADESSDTSCNVLFTTAATGNLAPKSGTNLTFNSSSGQLTATSFSGNGASLTSLNASNISSGTISASRVPTLNQDTTGTATNATNFNVAADNSTNSDHYIIFTGGATGNQRPNSDTALKYNPSSNTLTAGNFNSTSDIALKDNVNIIDNAADMIKNLQGIRWNWKQNGAASLGVSAQNVETVAPELVTNGDDYKSVNYNGLIGILIEAVKEQGNQINDLKQVITELKGKS